MLSQILCLLLLCTLLHTPGLAGRNPHLQVQRSRSYMSEAKVKSIQDILLSLLDSSSPKPAHIPQSNTLSHQKHRNPLNGSQYTVNDPSWYRPHQKGGYEVYEEPDETKSNAERNVSQQPKTGDLGLTGSTLSTRKANLQFHQMYLRKPTELLENTFGVSEAGDVPSYQRPRGYLNNEIKSIAPRETLVYQASPTQFQGNLATLSKPHVSFGLYPEISGFRGPHTLQRLNPLTAAILASSLGILAPVAPA